MNEFSLLICCSVVTTPHSIGHLLCPFAYLIPFALPSQIRAKSSVTPNIAPFHCSGRAKQGCDFPRRQNKTKLGNVPSLWHGKGAVEVLGQSW